MECLPCFFRQVSRTLSYAGINGDRGRSITLQANDIISRASLDQAPARISTLLHRLLREATGIDPYRDVKERYNRIALGMLPSVRSRAGTDLLAGGVRAAIAGNIIDFGIYESIDLEGSLQESFRLPLPGRAYAGFSAAVGRSSNILYLCDNAGEIVFDLLLIRFLKAQGARVTLAVKGAPVLNDATLVEAWQLGMEREVDLLTTTGSGDIGVTLEKIPGDLARALADATLIIAKGMANYESLTEYAPRLPPVAYLLTVKCETVAESIGAPVGASMAALEGAGPIPVSPGTG